MPIVVIYTASVLLFIGVAPLPYGYYTLLRIVTTGVFIWAAFVSHERKYTTLSWIFLVGAILFNPIIKIHLPKEFWIIIDIAAATILLINRKSILDQDPEKA